MHYVRDANSVTLNSTDRHSKEVSMDGSGSGEEPGGSAIEDVELFKSAVEQFRFVTAMFWQQAGFFLLIQTALGAAVSQSLPKGRPERGTLLGLSLLGLVLALFWAWVARKRVEIVKEWRREVVSLDQLVDRRHIYRKLDRDPLHSPTNVTMYLPRGLAVVWIGLMIYSIFCLPTPRC
jgi:hypothetical protein